MRRRVLQYSVWLHLCLLVVSQNDRQFVIPRLRITAFTPRGLKFTLHHEEGMEMVALIANINKNLTLSDNTGDLKLDIVSPRNGRWTTQAPDIELHVDDVLNYKLAVRYRGRIYFSQLHSYKINKLMSLPSEQHETIVWPDGTELAAGTFEQQAETPPKPNRPVQTSSPRPTQVQIKPNPNPPQTNLNSPTTNQRPNTSPNPNGPNMNRNPNMPQSSTSKSNNEQTPISATTIRIQTLPNTLGTTIRTTRRPPPKKPQPISPALSAASGVRPQLQAGNSAENSCVKSQTTVKGRNVCKGALVFEDHFDTLDPTKWIFDIRIADEPDYEFCVYDKRPENAFVEDGILHLKPTLTEQVHGKQFMTNGLLQLEECTGSTSMECEQQASFGYVMPAVTSSRLRSKFSFIYGRVEIRAKMAAGDWLISSLLLQPVRSNFYGTNYIAGQMRLGMVRGNRDLQCDDVDYGLSQLEAGVIMAVAEDQIKRDLTSRELVRGYHNDFHTYRVDWLPNKITFFVDGKVVSTIVPPDEGFASTFEDSDINPWKRGTKMAPFDREFLPALRLSAGGIYDFPDNCISNGSPKPWKNNHPKARLHFYQNQTVWAPTWKSSMEIDYVKIWAL